MIAAPRLNAWMALRCRATLGLDRDQENTRFWKDIPRATLKVPRARDGKISTMNEWDNESFFRSPQSRLKRKGELPNCSKAVCSMPDN